MRRKRKQRLKNLIILLLAVLAVLACLFLFRVRKLTVSGNSRYSAEEIKDDLITDFLSGNTFYLWWTHKDGSIPDTMPYLESIKVEIKSPVSVTVTVKEKELVGYFDTGSYAYFDESGIVLEITDELYEGIPVITGASLGEITLYQKVPTESSSTLRTILSLLELLEYQDLTVDEIRFAEDSDITVYIGYIEAELGQDEYLEEKVANLKAILDTLSASSAGTLHLENVTGKNEDIIFSPSDEVIVESETEEEQESDSFGSGSESTGSDSSGSGSESTDSDGSGSDSGSAGSGSTDTSTLGGVTTDGTLADSTGAAASSSADEGSADASASDDADTADSSDDENSGSDDSSDEEDSGVDLMVFNSSGQLVYHVRVQDGLVVDAYGNEVPGCSVNEDGYVVDAYWNIIDPATGELMN